jgi:tetratricopeptide (TPR) repeat protein
LQVDQYESCKRSNLIPQADEYGGKEPEMLARFISHLPDTTRRALRVASYPRWLDETLFLNLCEKFLGGAAVISLHELTAYSFWTKQADRYFLHAVMRDYLQAESLEREATLYRNIHQYLFEFHDSKLQTINSARDLTEEHNKALSEGAYHQEQLDYTKIPYWAEKYHEFFRTAAQWTVLEPLLNQALAIFQQTGNKQGEGAAFSNIGAIAIAKGDLRNAIIFLNKSLFIQQQIGDKSGEGRTLNSLAQIFKSQGNAEIALKYLEQSLDILNQSNDELGKGLILNNISQIYQERGDFNKSLTFLQQSLTIQQQIGNKIGEGTVLNNISLVYSALGDWEIALDYLEQSLIIRCQIGDKAGEGITLNNISQIYAGIGNHDIAFNYLKKALTIQQQIGDIEGCSKSLFNIGHTHLKRAEEAEAIQAWVTAYIFARKISYAQVLTALEVLAGKIGLPNGLHGWETLAQQMNQS